MNKVLLIANPKSGTIRFDKAISAVINSFNKYRIESTLIETEYVGHAVDILKNENLSFFDSVCAMGGDGTLFEVLNGMLLRPKNDRVPISVIPNGTGNSFMKTVGLADWGSAIKAIERNSAKKIDCMKASCGQKNFFSLNLIGWGMATDISVFAEKLRAFGSQRYNIASFFEIIKNKRRYAKLTVDGIERQGDFAFIIACNTKYVGKDMKMAPKALIDDGLIDLIIVKKASSLTLFSVFPKLFDGTHVNHEACEYVHCKTFSIDPIEKGELNIDGEIIGTSPVSVSLVKGELELII
jgi:YegS/Rv2252/BmrU family lipid kinase